MAIREEENFRTENTLLSQTMRQPHAPSRQTRGIVSITKAFVEILVTSCDTSQGRSIVIGSSVVGPVALFPE